MERKVLIRKNCFASATKNLANANGRMKLTKKSARIVFIFGQFFTEHFSKSNEKTAPNMKSRKRPNIKNGNVLVTLLKSPTKKNQPMEETLAVALRSFLQQMAVHVFLPFMAVVEMELDSQWTEV